MEANQLSLSTSDKAKEVPISNGNKNVCKICDGSFKNKAQIKRHMRQIHNKEISYSCKYCENTFENCRNLTKHVKSTHKTSESYACDICEKQYPSIKSLTKHMIYVHDRLSPKCDLCNKRFAEPCALRIHIERSHEKKKPFGCKSCDKTFFDENGLKNHFARVTPLQKSHQDLKNILETPPITYENLAKNE